MTTEIEINVTEWKITIHPIKHYFFILGIPLIVPLVKKLRARVFRRQDDLFIAFRGFTFNLKSRDELLFLNEIFLQELYNLETSKNSIVIDVGMNVGFASIFFAKKKNVKAIYSFEPFELTYQQALVNLRLNNTISKKIVAYNYGLGKRDFDGKRPYIPELKGSMSIGKLHPKLSSAKKIMTNIQVKEASQAFEQVLMRHTASYIVVKMDCEGSEYDIMGQLDQSGLVKLVDCFIIEWHIKGASILLKTLTQSNFDIISINLGENEGIIYAFNSSKKKVHMPDVKMKKRLQ